MGYTTLEHISTYERYGKIQIAFAGGGETIRTGSSSYNQREGPDSEKPHLGEPRPGDMTPGQVFDSARRREPERDGAAWGSGHRRGGGG
jgi:hypothetical protein